MRKLLPDMMLKIRRSSLRKFAVYGTILGYWYNIPVLSTSIFGGYNEFRIYDFTFILFYLLIFTSDRKLITETLIEKPFLKKLYRFVLWCTIMTPVAILYFLINSKLVRIGSTIIYLHHLWGFFLCGVYLVILSKEQQVSKLVTFFLVLNGIILAIFFLQRAGTLPSFWNIRYIESYGEDMTLSATLGPNRIVFGMMSSMGFIFSLFVIFSKIDLNTIGKVSTWFILLFTPPAIIMCGSRTAFIFISLFLLIYLLFFNRRMLFLVFFLLLVLPYFYTKVLKEKHVQLIENQISYNKRKLLRGDQVSDITITEAYDRVGSNRGDILRKTSSFLLENPLIWPFGGGFNNQVSQVKVLVLLCLTTFILP